MRFFIRKRRQPPAVIIVALIDVLIVLLIFLVVTTTFKRQPSLRLALRRRFGWRYRNQRKPSSLAPPTLRRSSLPSLRMANSFSARTSCPSRWNG
jgi:hypothetical protein